jgi:hypothetical protein
MTAIKKYSELIVQRFRAVIFPVCFTILILISGIFLPSPVSGQTEPEYDEISVFLEVTGIGGFEIDAIIKDGNIYLPVTGFFDLLKIRNTASPDMDTISGFFITREAVYTISRLSNQISYEGKVFVLEPGSLIRTETHLYLRSSYYGTIFGLDCFFEFRNLSVKVKTRIELPAIRELRQNEMRLNLSRLKGEIKADTSIGRSYPMFHFGMADWSVITTEETGGHAGVGLNLALGAIIAGGETTVALNYNSRYPFTEKQQFYLWRYVNNDNRSLRQVTAGKISTRATSSVYNPVVGVQFTNTPTTFRRSFGSYTLSDRTEPDWIVELYVNNVLVDFVKADASGFFSFEVPLVYGNSTVRLKFYGPWGEERIREQNIIIPFNFLPPKTLEYSISAGVVEDTLFSRFSRAGMNYGLSRGITLGAGMEYLSSVRSGPFMPFVNASVRLTSNLLLWGEYAHTVRAKGTLTYRLPSNIQIELDYTKYDRDQKAIYYNYLEERKAVLSIPLKIKKFSAYNRITFNQIIMPAAKYSTAEWMISGSVSGVNLNLSTYALFPGLGEPYIYSNLSLSFRFPGSLSIIPQVQYGYTENMLLSAKLGLEKRILQHGFLNLSYEQNFRNDLHMGEIGFRYDFKFAQTGASARQINRVTSFTQYARGSFINDRRSGYLGTDNRANVGKGGITIIPYLDLNGNGRHDAREPRASGLNIRTNGGRIERSERDTSIRILGLEPYTDCFIQLDQASFENIAYRLKFTTISVTVDPNKLKLIEIPVFVAGEASGTVLIEKDGVNTGLARILVNFYDKDQRLAGRTLTEGDGYFSYLGLPPGSFTVRPDSVQLRKLDMVPTPESVSFSIAETMEGDFVDGLDFVVRMKNEVTGITSESHKPERDTTYIVIHEVTRDIMLSGKDTYAIQMGAFKYYTNARAYRKRLAAALNRDVDLIVEAGFYKIQIKGFLSRKELDDFIPVLKRNGINEMWVITLKAKQKQTEIITVQDTVTEATAIRKDTLTRLIDPAVLPQPVYSLQVAVFHNKANALRAQKGIALKLGLPVEIIRDFDYYKVIIPGFYTRNETYKYYPELAGMGYNAIYLIEKKKK